jgi:predicted TIM-barrel fold metal-dependent hydrolase
MIPIIDVHAHIGDLDNVARYLQVRQVLLEQYDVDLAMWLNLRSPLGPRGEGLDYLEQVESTYGGRVLTCLTNGPISKGLRFSPEELVEWMERGAVGYKIWVGVSAAIDHPANDPALTKMEQVGLPAASIHIAQPYPTSWCTDAVAFWRAQSAWERVLNRHPDLVAVNAHMLDLFYSDEQLDRLTYMLETYPNLHVDLAARFQQFHRMDYDRLRAFVMKYADRILFGTDVGEVGEEDVEAIAARYYRCFQLLETDEVQPGGFFGDTPTKGLALPQEVLDKIYYQNAARLYPRVADVLKELGCELLNH